MVYPLQFETPVGPAELTGPSLPQPAVRAPAPSIVEPSSQALLERAAALGPVRLTFESIATPDPILEAKHEPRIAERRARLTRFVKVTLGACVGVCVLALGVSIFSGSEAQAATTSKAMPARVEKNETQLAGGVRGKATKAPQTVSTVAAARPAMPARPYKRR